MLNNTLVLYTQKEDKGKAASIPNAEIRRLAFEEHTTAGYVNICTRNLPPESYNVYDYLIFIAHGSLRTHGGKKRGVMTCTGGAGNCVAGSIVTMASIAQVLKLYKPKFILFAVCYMGRGMTIKKIYEQAITAYQYNHTCLLCAHKDVTLYAKNIPLALFGNRFYGRKNDGEPVDIHSCAISADFREEFEAYRNKDVE